MHALNVFKTMTAVLVLAIPAAADIDLAARYSATLDHTADPIGREWVSTDVDVWLLTDFSLQHADDLSVTLGKSTVVFGRADTNVLWAAVFPDQPGTIQTSQAGDGDQVTSIWLRFHPAEVGRLFPAKTVLSTGPAARLRDAKRLAAWKMIASWQANNLPVVPARGAIVVDIDTPHPIRRFYSIENESKPVLYVEAFEGRPLPRDLAVDRDTAVKAFKEVWEAFDREYAMFGVKPKVDWEAARKRYAVEAEHARTCYELAAVLADMLANLEDLHAWVRCGNEWLPGFNRTRPLNASYQAVRAALPNAQQPGRELLWARTDDGLGYIAVFGLGDPKTVEAFDGALDQLADTWGLIVDLRFNGGGDETLAQQMAGRFLDQKHVYSLNQYRSGPKHTDLGQRFERAFEPRGPWRYESPVVVLIGQKTMSSAESFALMLAQCPQATTMGDRTAGSSGNPRVLQPGCNISIALPRWIDMDPSGKPIDAVGVPPKVRIDSKPEDFTAERDPVLDAALKRLRETPQDQRRSGKR